MCTAPYSARYDLGTYALRLQPHDIMIAQVFCFRIALPSYENDENLVIIQGNRRLIEAYAVHVLDVYDHYRFRAVQQELRRQGKEGWDGFLSRDSKWLDAALASDKGDLARYFSG
jgi:hypothetical protein